MTLVTLTLEERLLKIRCDAASISQDRPLTDADFTKCDEWTNTYLTALNRHDNKSTLLQLGQAMGAWLDNGAGWLEQLQWAAETPLIFEFVAPDKSRGEARRLLNVPWELLADEQGHWAGRASLVFCPVRRLGKSIKTPDPSPYKLGAVFMAAAPQGATPLQFEQEEAAILKATRQIGMDLVVEDSGTLPLLREVVMREKPEVVHISCHGRLEPQPVLALEDETGALQLVTTEKITSELAGHRARLLFLSACQTAMSNDVVSSLSWSLVQNVATAVLGWAGSVRDHEATEFAHLLYRRLAAGEDLAGAVAHARRELMEPPQSALGQTASHDWHLARLYLGPTGGGILATGDRGQRHSQSGTAYKGFLDEKRQTVPVAGPMEFVGRRRALQTILREFNRPSDERRAGVFIHGLGRQGKSSLAARRSAFGRAALPDHRAAWPLRCPGHSQCL